MDIQQMSQVKPTYERYWSVSSNYCCCFIAISPNLCSFIALFSFQPPSSSIHNPKEIGPEMKTEKIYPEVVDNVIKTSKQKGKLINATERVSLNTCKTKPLPANIDPNIIVR